MLRTVRALLFAAPAAAQKRSHSRKRPSTACRRISSRHCWPKQARKWSILEDSSAESGRVPSSCASARFSPYFHDEKSLVLVRKISRLLLSVWRCHSGLLNERMPMTRLLLIDDGAATLGASFARPPLSDHPWVCEEARWGSINLERLEDRAADLIWRPLHLGRRRSRTSSGGCLNARWRPETRTASCCMHASTPRTLAFRDPPWRHKGVRQSLDARVLFSSFECKPSLKLGNAFEHFAEHESVKHSANEYVRTSSLGRRWPQG
jgi:hypothetical protein